MARLLRDDHPRRGRLLLCLVDNAATEEVQPGAPCRKRWRAVTQVGPDADRDRAKLRSSSPGRLCGARAERSDQRPDPIRPSRCQLHELPCMRDPGGRPHLAQHHLPLVDLHRGVGTLVRIDSNHHCCHDPGPFCLPGSAVAGMSFTGDRSASRLFRAMPRQTPDGLMHRSKARPHGWQAVRKSSPSDPSAQVAVGRKRSADQVPSMETCRTG
jgi:hypothetical protein